MANKIPVGDTIGFAYSNTFGNILPLLGLTWLPLAISAAIAYYSMTVWFEWMSKLPMFVSGHPDPHAMMAAMSDMTGYAGLGFLTMLVSLFMSAVVGVAVVTQALGMRTGQTFVHLAAGAPEWRVFGGYVRLFFAIMGVVLIGIVAVIIAAFIGRAISPTDSGSPIGGVIVAILSVAIWCLALLTMVRMSFVMVPSIVAEPGKGGLARSYHLTRGNFWRIVGIFLVTVLPVVIVQQAVIGAIIGSSFLAPLFEMQRQAMQNGGELPPEQMQQFLAHMLDTFRANIVPMSIISFVGSFFLSALVISAQSFAYRALSGGAPEAAPMPAPTPTPTPAT